MWTVRVEQMRAFEEAFLQECIEHVLQFLQKSVFETPPALRRETLEARVRQGVLRAIAYDLEKYSDISAFVALLFTAGPQFDSYPFFRSILTDPDIDPGDRIPTLVELARDEDWWLAEEQSPKSWLTEEN
jgi:hypothetical protein